MATAQTHHRVLVSRPRGLAYQGMNWIRREKRLAIYLRDGLACVWCGATIEDGAKLTLDHLKPHCANGSTDASNLVTACGRCNSSRANRTVETFAKAVATYLNHGTRAAQILLNVRIAVERRIDVAAAKEIIARRGGFVQAVRGESAGRR